MRVVFRSEAQQDLLDAQAWYEARATGLGMGFARAFEVALLAAVRQPERHPAVEGTTRRALLRRFPYALFYRVSGDEFLVLAVFHHRRAPGAMRVRARA